ncbi:hypothetical protein WAF17_08570 [Bernardetia sp. ABR2-2B]|uniref:hypothetical protein n=1 Tax=Bernardetia sp. ABR2-2B TaxID=3127472 RepID=UPI0030D38183
MRPLSLLFLLFFALAFTSCQTSTDTTETSDLPNDILENDDAFEKLFEYINSHYPDLDKNKIELMEFHYSANVGSQDDFSSSMSLTFVKGDDKDAIVEYDIDNDGSLSNSGVDITVGGPINGKISNTYETYQPYLFSPKVINLEVVRKAIKESTVKFKEATNVKKAYCSNFTIENKGNEKPTLQLRIKRRKFAATMSRSYKWTLEGDFIK